MIHHLPLFLLGSIVITIVPGPDMALITRQVVSRGRAAAQATIFGNLSGLVVHATALAAGLSALLVASATAYTTIKLAGAAYLVYLGVQSLRQARRSAAAVSGAGAKKSGNAYLQGLISTVLNPKPALFFLSYLPQFIDRRSKEFRSLSAAIPATGKENVVPAFVPTEAAPQRNAIGWRE